MGILEGKVAFITGAARGQGRSHAVRLAQEGADIIAVDICAQMSAVEYPMATPEDLAETVRLVEECDRRIVARQADVRDRGALEAVVEEGVAAFGRLDIVLANAGILTSYGDERVDEEETWRQVLDVDLSGTWRTVKVAIPHIMSGGQGGAIVLTSSTSGLKALDGGDGVAFESYTAAKHGVVGLMKMFAKTLAPHSIRVNSVHPTGVNTPMVVNEATQAVLARMEAAGAQTLTNLLPVELIEPEDVSNAILWLVSDAARYVTGVQLAVDAGFTLR
jgi:SDR family mycofactocin-dependent oxidoreductase